jgi:hypothetical protein
MQRTAQAISRGLHFLGNGPGVAALILGIVMLDPMIAILGMLMACCLEWPFPDRTESAEHACHPFGHSPAICGCCGSRLAGDWRRNVLALKKLTAGGATF